MLHCLNLCPKRQPEDQLTSILVIHIRSHKTWCDNRNYTVIDFIQKDGKLALENVTTDFCLVLPYSRCIIAQSYHFQWCCVKHVKLTYWISWQNKLYLPRSLALCPTGLCRWLINSITSIGSYKQVVLTAGCGWIHNELFHHPLTLE